MLPTLRSPLGAPGAFALPEVRPPTLHPQRLDGCAFVGVAPRGPARVPEVDAAWPPGWRQVAQATRPLRRSVPVAVRSCDEYLHSFGGFEGPGLLPQAPGLRATNSISRSSAPAGSLPRAQSVSNAAGAEDTTRTTQAMRPPCSK